jgi:hypothetical protein
VKHSKVDMIPGVPTTPRVMLEKMIERVDKTETLVIIEYTKDGDVEVWAPAMRRDHAVWIKSRFNKQFDP